MPDELLARVDAEAERTGRSRSAVLREFVQAGLDERSLRLATRLAELGAQARPHGGDVVGHIKAGRPR